MDEHSLDAICGRSVLEPTFSPDGSRISCFVSRPGDVEKTLVVASGVDEEPVRVAADRILDHGWLDPGRLWWVTEQLVYHTYETATGKTNRVELDPDPDWNRRLAFLADGSCSRSAAIVAHDRRIATVVYRRDGPKPGDVVYQPPSYTSLFDWHPSRDQLLARESVSTIDHRILVVDCERNRHRTFTPDRRGARFGSVQWGPDGDQIYCVTDANRDTLYGATVDVAAGEITPIVTHDRWNVDSIDVTHSGEVLYAVNENGESVVYTCRLTGDGTAGARRIDGLPNGVTKQADVSPSGDRVALAHSTESRPSRLYVYDRRSDSTSRWLATRGDDPSTSDRVGRRSESVRYESFDGRQIPALLSRPRGDSGRRGVVVDVHGGPERQRRPEYRPLRELFLSLGFAVFEPNIRGSTGYGRWYTTLDDQGRRADAVDDVAAAGRWLRSPAGIDADHVVAYGKSYGGFVALINSYRHSDVWDAAICTSAIYDLEDFLSNLGTGVQYLRVQEYGPPELMTSVFEELSPLRHAGEISIPILLAHGSADGQVPSDGAQSIVERVERRGETAQLLLFEDEGHRIRQRQNRAVLYERIGEFLDGTRA